MTVIPLTVTYTWHRVDGDLPVKATPAGEHSEMLVIPSVVTADEGNYYCTAEKFGHCAKSNNVTVIVDGKQMVGTALVVSLYWFGPNHALLSQMQNVNSDKMLFI